MKSKIMFLVLSVGLALLAGCAGANKVAYQTIGALEQSAVSANAAYLDSVVTGRVSTNSVPAIEAEFNATQLALHAAASFASEGTNAPASAVLTSQTESFITHTTLVK